MDLSTALLHWANFLAAPFFVGAFSAVALKLLWRRETHRVGLASALLVGCAAALLAAFGGLVLLGRDGAMASYAAMVLATAAALWWWGFRG